MQVRPGRRPDGAAGRTSPGFSAALRSTKHFSHSVQWIGALRNEPSQVRLEGHTMRMQGEHR
jgi:hypothetical protein